jgi:hypothetical protein
MTSRRWWLEDSTRTRLSQSDARPTAAKSGSHVALARRVADFQLEIHLIAARDACGGRTSALTPT